jgi:hypothetical protein
MGRITFVNDKTANLSLCFLTKRFLYGPLSAVDDDDFLFSDCGTLANFNGYWCLWYIHLSCCFKGLPNVLDVIVLLLIVRDSRCCYCCLESTKVFMHYLRSVL